jgi:hypothetical protein
MLSSRGGALLRTEMAACDDREKETCCDRILHREDLQKRECRGSAPRLPHIIVWQPNEPIAARRLAWATAIPQPDTWQIFLK